MDEVVSRLLSVRAGDPNPSEGRFFSYIYETGDPGVKRAAMAAYRLFLDSNALDPLVFRSTLFFEQEIVSFASRLASAPDGAVGTVTSGGTESIILAVLAARNRYQRLHGKDRAPRILAPITVHPSVAKAAHYLGLRLVRVPVDPESKKAGPEHFNEYITDDTALIVASAPNYPYGTIDDIAGIGELAADHNIPLHVDACLGGFILPYMREHGVDLPAWNFEAPGVWSLSMDVHKYGYSPKGASVLLFADPSYKAETVFVDTRWPGYPFINTGIVSSRSVAPIAAAWAVINYLGHDGYLALTARVLEARDTIVGGLSRLGLKPVHPVETSLVALASEEGDDRTLAYHIGMSRRRWVLGLQPALQGFAPLNVHLTITPIHKDVAHQFLADSEEALQEEPPEWVGQGPQLLAERTPQDLLQDPEAATIVQVLLATLGGALGEDEVKRLVVDFLAGQH